MTSEAASPESSPGTRRWRRPAPGSFRSALLLLAVLMVPGGLATAVGGIAAGMAVGIAAGSAMAFASVTDDRRSWWLILLVGVVTAAATAVAGVPWAASLVVAGTTLLLGVANRWSVGMLTMVPVLGLVFAVSDRGLTWWQAGLWSLFGAACGYGLLRAMRTRVEPQALAGGHAWRHAVVLAVAVGVTLFLVMRWEVPHGYWVPLTVLVALRPMPVERREVMADRLWGTVLGAVIAAVVVATLPPWAAMLVAVGCLAALAAYAISGNYFLQTVFLTPMLLLFASAGDEEQGLQYTLERVAFTLVGVALGVGLIALLAWWDARDGAPAVTTAAPPPSR